MSHTHPQTVEVCIVCDPWPEHARVLAAHINRLEHTVTESLQAQQDQLDAAEAAISANVDAVGQSMVSAFMELKAQIAANPAQPAGTLDLSKLAGVVQKTADLAAAASAEATADAPAPVVTDPVATGDPSDPADPASPANPDVPAPTDTPIGDSVPETGNTPL